MSQQFIATSEHRRFVEFATAVRQQHTIGICYGTAGVGKTLSARRYAKWDDVGALVEHWGPNTRGTDMEKKAYAAADRARTHFYTPHVGHTLKTLREEVRQGLARVNICIEEHHRDPSDPHGRTPPSMAELLIIDEAERLSPNTIEWIRDQHDRTAIAIIFIGMPGIEKQFARYPQLYSRIGFAHQYRPLGHDELLFVLDRYWRRLGQTLDPNDFTDAQAVAAIERITRGNFRLLERLLPQIQRVLKINQLSTITNDVIEAARSTLVVGINQ